MDQWDGSVEKDICPEAWNFDFGPQNPHGKREPTL